MDSIQNSIVSVLRTIFSVVITVFGKYSQLYDANDKVGSAAALVAKVQNDVATVVFPVVREGATHVYEAVVVDGFSRFYNASSEVVQPEVVVREIVVENSFVSSFVGAVRDLVEYLFVGWLSFAGVLLFIGIWQLVLHLLAIVGLTVLIMMVRWVDREATIKASAERFCESCEVLLSGEGDQVNGRVLYRSKVEDFGVGGYPEGDVVLSVAVGDDLEWIGCPYDGPAVGGEPAFIVAARDEFLQSQREQRDNVQFYEDDVAGYDKQDDGWSDDGWCAPALDDDESYRDDDENDRRDDEDWAREEAYGGGFVEDDECRDCEGMLRHNGRLFPAYQFFVHGGTRRVAMDAKDFSASLVRHQSDPFPDGLCYMLMFDERHWAAMIATERYTATVRQIQQWRWLYGLSDALIRYKLVGRQFHIVRASHAAEGFSGPMTPEQALEVWGAMTGPLITQ